MHQHHLSVQEEEQLFTDLDDLERLSPSSSQQDVDNCIAKYTTQLEHAIKMLRSRSDKRQEPKVSEDASQCNKVRCFVQPT